ncbi:alanine racemase [soil metagenome]
MVEKIVDLDQTTQNHLISMSAQPTRRPTEAIIDLDALEFNFRSCKSFIGPEVKYMAIVKADGYGHGAAACAARLESSGVDWFGVAIPEEGVELRLSGITRPILCLGSFWPGQESLIVEHRLTPAIYDEAAAKRLEKYASGIGSNVDIHVKIDTGMGRVGIKYSEATAFASMLAGLKHLRVSGLLTHFAAADDPAEDAYNNLQIDRFETACKAFHDAGHRPELIDLANSPGAIRFPNSRGNLVRLGGALYGLLDDILRPETTAPQLKPVLTLRSKIASIKRIAAGESLGYGRTFVTTRDSVIALVPVGYADGYPRGLSNCGKVSVNGSMVPVVGRISMDWTLVDVTDLPSAAVGSDVLLIGGGIRASALAAHLGTIGYEITCGLSKRIPRIYE